MRSTQKLKSLLLRVSLQELVEHPFWQAKLPVLPLPPEPALEAYIEMHNLAPARGDDSAANQVPAVWAEKMGACKLCCFPVVALLHA